jgi:hypothetical protein
VSFLLYVIGFVVVVTGLASIATAIGISQAYILIGAASLAGIGLLALATRTRVKDPA